MSVNDDECRLGYYRVASLLLLKPTKEILSEALSVIDELLSRGCKLVDRGVLEDLRDLVSGALGDLEGLQVEYTRLFINDYPRLECPPYETVYREEKREIMGRYALEMAKLLDEIGLEVSEGFREPPEHVALELEAMVYLIHRSLMEGREDYCTQWRVFGDHIARWVPSYADCLSKAARHELYKRLADFLKKLVRSEEKLLGVYEEVCME